MNISLFPVLLWFNPNPTASFAAQTVDVNMSNTAFLIIQTYEFVGDSSRLTSFYNLIAINGTTDISCNLINPYNKSSSSLDAQMRSCTIQIVNNKITFGAGNGGRENRCVVPVAVYGMQIY